MRNLQLAPTISSDIPPIIDITDQLPRKAAWESMAKKNIVRGVWDRTYHTGFRDPEDITAIIVHHSGPPNGTLESHAKHHANKWGAGISYHIAIDQGKIKQLNDLRSFTFHAGNNNTYSVGIVVNRDLTNNDLTDLERKLLYAAIMSVKAVLPITEILGHREVAPTACPVTSMDRIREDIFAMEQEQILMNSKEKQLEIAGRMLNQVTYLHRMANGKMPTGEASSEHQQNWARLKLMEFEPEFRRLGWLK